MAFNSTARYLDGYNAADQGNGLINVPAAWELLKDRVEPVNITSRVRVNTILSDFLAEPGFGRGIFDREGVTLGQRTPAPTRSPEPPARAGRCCTTSGGSATTARSRRRTTFCSASTFRRRSRAGQPVQHGYPLRDPEPGQLVHGRDRVPDHEHRHRPGRADRCERLVTKTGMASRNQVQRFFFRVPAGNPVLKVDLTARAMLRAQARCASCASTRGASPSTRTRARRATCRLRGLHDR